MTESELDRISRDIEDLKKAVKRNDPLLREITAPPGWIFLSLLGGILTTMFALPAHILTGIYGSFGAIPPGLKALLFSILAVFAVGGGIAKMIMIYKKMNMFKMEGARGFQELLTSFFGGSLTHTTIPTLALLGVLITFAFIRGEPWMALPFTSLMMGLFLNRIGERSAVRAYYIAGYWSLVTGACSLFLASQAIFLWLFIVFGGLFFAFAAALAVEKSFKAGKNT